MDIIELKNVSKKFGDLSVLKNLSFSIKKGECVAISGPSGAGKTTLLRSLAKLEEIEGNISIKNNAKTEMVFQNFNLFPHMSVMKNIILGPIKIKGIKIKDAKEKARKVLKMLKIADKEKEMPSNLSGGQKQRVAIARALMMEPDILLFDEPTSALDFGMRDEVGGIIKELNKKGITIVFVSHDEEFVKSIASRVILV